MSSHRAQLAQFTTGEGRETDLLRRVAVPLALVAACALAIYARVVVGGHESPDYQIYLEKWYDHLRALGRRAFQHRFADYNMPYLYLLWLAAKLHVPALLSAKLIAGLFDIVLCIGVFRVISYLRGWVFGLAAAAGVALLPTVWLNSGAWGQLDAMYTGFLLLSLSALLRRRQRWCWFWFGVAIAFKLQAIFFLPFLGVAWVLHRRRDWFAPLFLVIPLVLAGLPAIASGMPWRMYVGTYSEQAAQVAFLSQAPNLPLVFVPNGRGLPPLDSAFTAVTAGVVLILMAALVVRRGWQDPTRVVAAAAALTFMFPYLLPHMRARYFYPAEILLLLLVMLRPRRWWLALVMETIMITTYALDLFQSHLPIELHWLAIAMSIVVVGTVYEAFRATPEAAAPVVATVEETTTVENTTEPVAETTDAVADGSEPAEDGVVVESDDPAEV